MINLELPYPPSANRYWRYTSRGVYVTKEARSYKQEIVNLTRSLNLKCYDDKQKLKVFIVCHVPDKRRRDLDNVLKITLDSLSSIAWEDDSQIDDLRIIRGDIIKNGKLELTVSEI